MEAKLLDDSVADTIVSVIATRIRSDIPAELNALKTKHSLRAATSGVRT
jgi:hypothetical protein